ncbi:hypothetical protein PYK79_38730 [Streptomyces sp. ID05-04B]|uniref:hypothetical protein n=1 Tax=Streptomyces sp. ID05-04B TaxID=3028661 RepID=UPI0029C512EC|nr:hypothetical protein [Streptomyces sp. ID05-04B]MDX5568022.1 hypothetical protein [Streptomyces sp. ID05-04B]
MSGSRSLPEQVADQPAPLGEVTVHRYFGGRALHSHGIQFAMSWCTCCSASAHVIDDRTEPCALAPAALA